MRTLPYLRDALAAHVGEIDDRLDNRGACASNRLEFIGASLVHLIVFARLSRPKDPAFDPIDQDATP
jgi:hypothetical protein